MGKNICSFCGEDMGWDAMQVINHQAQCIQTQNALGVRPNLYTEHKSDEPDVETVRIYPDEVPGLFEEN